MSKVKPSKNELKMISSVKSFFMLKLFVVMHQINFLFGSCANFMPLSALLAESAEGSVIVTYSE
jgi:hypothetical protein